jgi:UDP:flavonoid glycosyltransferase YjiC (YdhE family)
LNRYRAEVGMPPEHRVLTWWNSPDRVLAFFPEWFAPRHSEWPAQLKHVGFPLFDGWESRWEHEEFDRYLSEGDPPLVFSQSSNVGTTDDESLAVSVEAAKRLGRRAIILTAHPERLPHPLPDHVRYFGIVPLSVVLPRAAAFIHHGGMGSLSQALTAGVPQLAVPRILDQPDNCRWLARLGVSRMLTHRQYRVERVVDGLKFLLESREIRNRCGELSRQLSTEDPFEAACEELERLAHRPALSLQAR